MKRTLLINSVLASTLFASQVSAAPITTVVTTNQDTAVVGDVEVAPTGQILINVGEAVTVDTDSTSVTLDANNVNNPNNSAILTTAPGGTNGIDIVNGKTGQLATVLIGVTSAITANTDGILIDNLAATVTNYGTITAGNSAIDITANGQTATINNQGTGILLSTAAMPTILVQVGGTGLTLANAGIIKNTGTADAVQIHDSFMSFNNGQFGTIQAQGANTNAINITGATPVTGDIINSGNIIQTSNGNAIFINNTLFGSINNLSGAVIQNTGTGVALNLAEAFMGVNNSGFIQATKAGGTAIEVNNNISGIINNAGFVTSVDQSAILLNGNITQIINSDGGIISSDNANGIIYASAPITINGGITNNGIITNATATSPAINLQTNSAKSNITQLGGIITGNILLAPFDGTGNPGPVDVFDMFGGQINGNVVAANLAGNQNILTLAGGIITGNVTLGNQGDTVNLAGTTLNGPTGVLNGGAGKDTFNLSHGSFNQLNGNGGVDTINVLANFTALSQTGGTIDGVGTINVNSNVNFFVNMPIVNMNGGLVTVMPGGSLIANENITGNSNITNNGGIAIESGKTIDVSAAPGIVTNNGTLNIFTDGVLKAHTYLQVAGIYEVQLSTPAHLGQIQAGAGGANLDANSFIEPLTTGAFIPAGTKFDIIQAPLGLIVDNSTVKPFSVSLAFEKNTVVCGANSCVELTAQRIPYSILSGTILGQEVGSVLDVLASQPVANINPDLLNLLGQLDFFTSAAELDTALVSLAPVVNGALAMQSRASMTAAFKSVERRLEDLRHLRPLGEERYKIRRNSGLNYGEYDSAEETLVYEADVPLGGMWLKAMGGVLDQRTRNQVDGYLGYLGGMAIGGDWGIPGFASIGAAVSRTNTNTNGKTDNENVIDDVGNQFILYGWFNPVPMEPIFVDVMIGLATHTYDTRRNIGIGNIATASFAHFFGLQYGAQLDAGYGFTYDALIVSPIARVKFTRLEVDSYTEGGAGGLSLAASSEGLNELTIGAGLRALGKMDYGQALYCPEASAMFFYDFYADREELVADFLGFGNVGFPVTGIKPKHTGLLLGVGVTAHYHDHYVFTTKYDLELRDHFFGHAAYMQLQYQWF